VNPTIFSFYFQLTTIFLATGSRGDVEETGTNVTAAALPTAPTAAPPLLVIVPAPEAADSAATTDEAAATASETTGIIPSSDGVDAPPEQQEEEYCQPPAMELEKQAVQEQELSPEDAAVEEVKAGSGTAEAVLVGPSELVEAAQEAEEDLAPEVDQEETAAPLEIRTLPETGSPEPEEVGSRLRETRGEVSFIVCLRNKFPWNLRSPEKVADEDLFIIFINKVR
jgi:hypothetical protein